MTTVLALITMALIGLFGGKAQGCVFCFVCALLLAWAYHDDGLFGLLVLVIPYAVILLGYAIYNFKKNMRKKWEIAKYGFELTEERMNAYYKDENYNIKALKSGRIKILTDEDRKRIAEIGVDRWKIEQTTRMDEMGKDAWGEEQIKLYQMPKPKRKQAANIMNESNIFWFDKMRPMLQAWLTVKEALASARYKNEHAGKDITTAYQHGGKI